MSAVFFGGTMRKTHVMTGPLEPTDVVSGVCEFYGKKHSIPQPAHDMSLSITVTSLFDINHC